MDPATSPPLSLASDRPTYTDSEIDENPWLAVEPILYEIESYGGGNTLASAARDINVLFFQFGGESASGGFLNFFWGLRWLLHRMAVKLPWEGTYQDRLADLLVTLRELSKPLEIEIPQWWTSNLWADLPLLGANAREKTQPVQGP